MKLLETLGNHSIHIYVYIYILKNDMKLREIKYYDIIKYNHEVINSQKQI